MSFCSQAKGHEGVFILLKYLLFGELLDALFFTQPANQQRIVFLCHNISVQPLHNNFLLLGSMNNTISCFKKFDVFTNTRIIMRIFS